MGSKLENESTGNTEAFPKKYWHDRDGLNIETDQYPENRKGGLLICGMNWGGDPDKSQSNSSQNGEATFFSDISKSYDYKDCIVEWFELLGHPLQRIKGKEGPFERSLLQTNWLRTKSKSVDMANFKTNCIHEWSYFESRIAKLRPSVIMFLSVEMLDALNSRKCKKQAIQLLGKITKRDFRQRKGEVQKGTDGMTRFRIRVQWHEHAVIIALPHPTGSWGLDSKYIAAFRDLLSPILAAYKEARKFKG